MNRPIKFSKLALTKIIRSLISGFIFFTLLLDRIFFRNKRQIEKPIFIIGHLRSGTTFLHRFMCDNCMDLKGMMLFEMLLPAITARKISKPLLPLLKRISLDKVYDPKIHETNFFLPETDDIAIHFRYAEGILSWVYFGSWQKYASTEDLEKSVRSAAEKDKFIYYLRRIHENNIYQSPKRVVSKSFFSIFNIRTILEAFPDAKIIVLLRDPLETVPSLMSLERNVQASLHNFDQQDEDTKALFFENLYAMSLFYYKYLDNLFSDEKFKDKLHLVTYNELKNNFKRTMLRIMDYCELERNADVLHAIEIQNNKQATYKTEHKYSLEDFNLSQKQLRQDFDFIYPWLNPL